MKICRLIGIAKVGLSAYISWLSIMKSMVIIVIFTFTQLDCNSQSKLEFGKVVEDSTFLRDPQKYKFHSYYDSTNFNINTIDKSINQIEIRLYAQGLPHGNSYLSILTYNDSLWDLRKYTLKNFGFMNIINTVTLIKNKKELFLYNNCFEGIFKSLVENEIFSLPNQTDLGVENNLSDGVVYSLVYKVNNKYRMYHFTNPTMMFKDNPTIKQFKEYENIASILNSSLFN